MRRWSRGELITGAVRAGGTWLVGGLIAWCVIAGLTADGNGRVTSAGYVAMVVWGVPVLIVLVAGLVYGLAWLAIGLWRERRDALMLESAPDEEYPPGSGPYGF